MSSQVPTELPPVESRTARGGGLMVRVASSLLETHLQSSSYALTGNVVLDRAALDSLSAVLRAPAEASYQALPTLTRARLDPGYESASKMRHLPPAASRILALGCGAGAELKELRARYPGAELVATDLTDQLGPQRWAALGVRMVTGDMHQLLGQELRDFDLVFSHHVLEHSYHPEQTLAAVHAALREGGCCYAVLPLEAEPVNPLWAQQRMLAGADGVHPVDVSMLDPGHPWKASCADLLSTARASGFARLELAAVQPPGWLHVWQRRGWWLAHQLSLRPLRTLFRLLPRAKFPRPLRRLFAVLDARLPFGAARLKNQHSAEVVMRAWR